MTHEDILQMLAQWDGAIDFSVRLIACGGAALTLLDLKPSTRELDFMVPDQDEYSRLTAFLPNIGYRAQNGSFYHEDRPEIPCRFWSGNRFCAVDLLESPLKDTNHTMIKTWSSVYLGVMNLIDLIIGLLFRDTEADFEDCIAAFKTWKVDAEELLERYAKVSSTAPNPDQRMQQFMTFVEELVAYHLVSDDFLEKVSLRKVFEKQR